MKHNKIRYFAAFAASAAVVAFSIWMPGVFLNLSGESTANHLTVVSNGISPSLSKPAAKSVESVSQLSEKVRLFEYGSKKSSLSKEYSDGSMGMSDAVNTCILRVSSFLNKNAIPPLNHFPQSFSVKAELRELSDGNGKTALQFWDVSFTQNDDRMNAAVNGQEIWISLDAQTGAILGMTMNVTSQNNSSNTVDIANSAKVIAEELNLPGKLVSADQRSGIKTALWEFDQSSLSMQLTLAQKSSATFFSMTLKPADVTFTIQLLCKDATASRYD